MPKKSSIYPERKTAAVIYARFSPRRNAELCESIEVQREVCEKYAIDHGYAISPHTFFYDEAMSGDEIERPGLWGAMGALRRKRVLVAHKADRLARDVLLMEMLYAEAKKKGARIEIVSGVSNGDSAEDVLLRQIVAAVSQYEKKVIAARTKFSMLRHQEHGRAMGSTPPYGMMFGEPDEFLVRGALVKRNTLVPCEEEQENINLVLTLRRSGMTYRLICRQLENMNISCRGKSHWDPKLIHRIVKRAGGDAALSAGPLA